MQHKIAMTFKLMGKLNYLTKFKLSLGEEILFRASRIKKTENQEQNCFLLSHSASGPSLCNGTDSSLGREGTNNEPI